MPSAYSGVVKSQLEHCVRLQGIPAVAEEPGKPHARRNRLPVRLDDIRPLRQEYHGLRALGGLLRLVNKEDLFRQQHPRRIVRPRVECSHGCALVDQSPYQVQVARPLQQTTTTLTPSGQDARVTQKVQSALRVTEAAQIDIGRVKGIQRGQLA